MKEERNTWHRATGREANWIGHILRRNALLKHVIEGKTEGTGRRGTGRKQLLNDLKEKSVLETESSSIRSHSPKNSSGRGYRPVVRQCGDYDDDDDNDNDEYPW